MFVLSLRGDAAMWRTSGKSGTSSAQEMLTSLESVCDSLRSSLHWRKTRCGTVKMSNTYDATSPVDGSAGISIEPGATGGHE
jgi:hypothetical protein